MKPDSCTYPPQLAADVEITEQRDGDRQSFIIGSVSVGRFILLREAEHKVLRLLAESHTPAAVCAAFKQLHDATLTLSTLTRFLTKLDELGILAGARTQREAADDPQASAQFYYRLRLFHPEHLFARIVTPLRWIWTPGFAWASLGLILLTAALALLAWFLFVPYTLLADLAFIVFLGGVVDVIFNANPLIKLDGYYFLSQWLRLPNLLDRSRAYWRGLLKRLLWGESNEAAAKWSRRERWIYGLYGLVPFV